jgi:hypothetical protein
MNEPPFRVSVVMEAVDWVDQGGGLRLPIPRKLGSFSVEGSRQDMEAALRVACEALKAIREMQTYEADAMRQG